MKRRFCGIDLGSALEGIRPLDDLRKVAIYALEETLTRDLPYHVLRDDGAPAASYCVLILGRIGTDIHFVSIDGPKSVDRAAPDLPIAVIRTAVAAIPDGRPGRGHMRKVFASPYATAGILMVAQTDAGAMNCAFARNPALHHDDAARLLKAYLTRTLLTWTGTN